MNEKIDRVWYIYVSSLVSHERVRILSSDDKREGKDQTIIMRVSSFDHIYGTEITNKKYSQT